MTRASSTEIEEKRDMERVTIEIDRDDLPTHTDDEFEEWVRFCVGYQADIDSTNPLSDMDMTAQSVMVG